MVGRHPPFARTPGYEMLANLMNAVLGSTLSATQRLLLLVIAFRGDDGARYTAVSTLVEETGLSESTIHRELKALRLAGALERLTVVGEPNHYRILVGGITMRPGGVTTTPTPPHRDTPPPVTTTPGGCHHDTQEDRTRISLSLSREKRARATPPDDTPPSEEKPRVSLSTEKDERTNEVLAWQRNEPTKRDRFAVERAFQRGTTPDELRVLLDYMRLSPDRDPICSRKGATPWGESFASVLGRPERIEAAKRWHTAGRPVVQGQVVSFQRQPAPGERAAEAMAAYRAHKAAKAAATGGQKHHG